MCVCVCVRVCVCACVCVRVCVCTHNDLTTVSDALPIQDGPEEWDTIKRLVLSKHVLGCHPSVFVGQLPVTDVGRVTNQREGEASNVSSSKHILTCLHELGRGGERMKRGGEGGEKWKRRKENRM